MFSNLIRIELIRLIKSRALRYYIGICSIAFVFIGIVSLFIVSSTGFWEFIEAEMTAAEFFASVFIFAVALCSLAGAPVIVSFVTCEYHTNRLAVNIEGAERSALKLSLSKITGAAVFCALLNLPSLPAIIFIGADSPLKVWLEITLINIYMCAISYLISELVKSATASITIFLASAFLIVLLISFSSGIIEGYGIKSPETERLIIKTAEIIITALPVCALSYVCLAKRIKGDRL